MASLHTITSEIRTGGKWIGIIIGLFIIVLLVWRLGGNIKEMISPTPPPPPTVSFGKLPALQFPSAGETSVYSYTLNTVSGTLPTFSDRATIFKITPAEPNLLAPQRAREKVAQVGFRSSGIALSPTVYQWDESVSPFRKLVVEVLNFNFNLTSSYMVDEVIKKGTQLPPEPAAIDTTQRFLESLLPIPTDLDTTKTKTSLLSISGAQLVPATSLSTAQVIRVDFYQKNVNDLEIFYSNPPYSSMNFLIAGGKNDGQVVEAHYFHHTISSESATYPIITANQAWEMLKKGEGFVVNYNGSDKNVIIKNVQLGYYASNQKQDYLMPVVVFQGDNDFYAYVPAVQKDWIEK